MFTKNKKNYTTFIYVAIIVTLCLLIIALAWPQDIEPVNEDQQGQTLVSNNETADDDNDNDNEVNDVNNNNDALDDDSYDYDHDEEKNIMSDEASSYYLVKRAGSQIIVFFCDASGQQIQLETTEILYELLGPEDQKKFEEGIKIKSQEELAVLLQDFES